MAPDCSLNITGSAITTVQGLFVTYCITFTFSLLCLVPFWVQLVISCDNLCKLHCFNIFTGVFVKIFCIWNIIAGLYQVVHQCGHSNQNNQIQHRNTPDNISDILGTRVYQGYVETPLQTLDGIAVNQPKWFLPLAEEAKHIAEEIRIEKINEQWAGIPREQLLNQSFTDQLNSIQILEQLTPFQLAKEHLPGDIIDILERLGKVDNLPFNQLYYIAENCADRYYSKVIETFISILKCQFANHQLLLIYTA